MNYYILKDGIPHKCGLFEWADWFENHGNERILEQTLIGDGTVGVSTVFIGIDFNFITSDRHSHKPLLFETMIFGGPHHAEIERCSTMQQAEKQHEVMVKRASRGATKEVTGASLKGPWWDGVGDWSESVLARIMREQQAALERERLRRITGLPYPMPEDPGTYNEGPGTIE